MELKDIVYIDFKPISSHAMLISEFTEVYEYNKDNTRSNKVRGYKGEFVISEGEYMGIRFAVEFDKLPRAELMHKYSIEFDEENSSVYASKNKFGLQFKLVGLALVEE